VNVFQPKVRNKFEIAPDPTQPEGKNIEKFGIFRGNFQAKSKPKMADPT